MAAEAALSPMAHLLASLQCLQLCHPVPSLGFSPRLLEFCSSHAASNEHVWTLALYQNWLPALGAALTPAHHSFWGGGVTLSRYSLEDFTSTRLFFSPSQLQLVSQPPLITSIVLLQRRFLFRYGLWLITASSWRRKTRKHRFSTQDIIGTALSESLLAFKISWAGPIFFFISFNTLIFQAPTEQPSKSVELNTQ